MRGGMTVYDGLSPGGRYMEEDSDDDAGGDDDGPGEETGDGRGGEGFGPEEEPEADFNEETRGKLLNPKWVTRTLSCSRTLGWLYSSNYLWVCAASSGFL